MRLTKASLANPAAMIIIAAVVVLLGALSLMKIPAQLLPQIEKPIVTVMTAWPGASPKEIESELIVPVEEVLQGTPGMTEFISWSMPNFGFMQLEFALETDMTRTLIEIISRLNRLRPLPANAERPQVSLGVWGDANDQLIEYFVEQNVTHKLLWGTDAAFMSGAHQFGRVLLAQIAPEVGEELGLPEPERRVGVSRVR